MSYAVIFDMDGLLIDSEAVTYKLYSEICERYGKVLQKDFYFSLLGTNKATIQNQLGAYMGSETMAVNIINEVHDRLEELFRRGKVPTKPGARSLMENLKQNGIKLVVATSSDRKRAEEILTLAGLKPFLDGMVCGDEVSKGKPNPEIFLKGAALAGVEPGAAIVLEDSENGIIGASTGGIHCINIPDLKEPSQKVLDRADHIARNLDEAGQYIQVWLDERDRVKASR